MILSTLFPHADPTLNVDNVTRVMKKVEPEKRDEMWESVLLSSSVYDAINEQYSPEERELACVDIYVHSRLTSSWTDLAKLLYRHHQVVAVEELRSYLPPRGKLCRNPCIYGENKKGAYSVECQLSAILCPSFCNSR